MKQSTTYAKWLEFFDKRSARIRFGNTCATRHARIESLHRHERVMNWLALIVIIAMAVFVAVNLFGIAWLGW